MAEAGSVINKDFVGVSPDDSDIPSVELLCKQLFRQWPVNTRAMSELLVSQSSITSVLKAENDEFHYDDDDDDENCYAVFSLINLKVKKNEPCVQQLLSKILLHAADHVDGGIFTELLSEDSPAKVAFLVKETMSNLPDIAVAPMICQLIGDMMAAITEGMPYAFTHYVTVVKVAKVDNETYFIDESDEILHEAHLRFLDIPYEQNLDFDVNVIVEDSEGRTKSGVAFRRVYLLSSAHFKSYVESVCKIPEVTTLLEEAGNIAHLNNINHIL